MLYHIILLRYTERADAAFQAGVHAYVDRIRSQCTGLRRLEYGKNIADRGKGYDWVWVSAFDSQDAHENFQISTVHQELKMYLAPFVADVVVCDADFSSPAAT